MDVWLLSRCGNTLSGANTRFGWLNALSQYLKHSFGTITATSKTLVSSFQFPEFER